MKCPKEDKSSNEKRGQTQGQNLEKSEACMACLSLYSASIPDQTEDHTK